MSEGPLKRRLIALERVDAARGLVIRAYTTRAEADADNEPVRWGVTVLKVITGVPRAPGAGGSVAA